MGMFDTVFAELDCPFCGRQYRYSPMSWEEAEREVRRHKQWETESRQRFLDGNKDLFSLQDQWAKRAGFDDIDAWIAQLDTPDKIEAHRTRRHLGLAEIQTKQFENVLAEFFVGDEIPQYTGHYFIREDFTCDGCSSGDESVWVNVWFEIEERRLKAVLTRNPETGEPEREIHKHVPVEPRPPDPHPPLHFKHRKIQAHARWNDETKTYDMEVHRLPEHYTFSNESEELLRIAFESFADDYLYLIGKGRDDQPSLHERLHSICRHLPSDFEPYGQRERDGADCSCGCKHFLKLPDKLGYDWGVCANPASPRAGSLTFEHQGCERFESDETLEAE
ncbi:MAG: hypothetical protein B6D40_08970 [Anaerolineae bacterium UTCFX3]|jgi:hypothetical protein|nr:MAG: hypothetical protein B6D40_08970 [Anaerolineae bacterium UTCFX3]